MAEVHAKRLIHHMRRLGEHHAAAHAAAHEAAHRHRQRPEPPIDETAAAVIARAIHNG
jgi:hypothetical protein